jgi:hypothetical protein
MRRESLLSTFAWMCVGKLHVLNATGASRVGGLGFMVGAVSALMVETVGGGGRMWEKE